MANIESLIAGIGHEAHNRVTFDANSTGKVGTVTLFNVTGTVAVRLFALTQVDVAGSGSIAVGTAITPTGLITTTTGSDLDAGDIWHDATPDASVELSSVVAEKIVNQDIIATITSNTLTAGRVLFIAIWKPISENASLVSANLGGSASPSVSPSASQSASSSLSPSSSISPSASISPSSSASASLSPSASRSPSASISPSSSLSPSSSSSASRSPSASASSSTSPSSSISASISPSSSASSSASASQSPSSSTSPSISPSPL